MLANDLTLNPTSYGGANEAKEYKLISFPGQDDGSLRRVTATALTSPDTLSIKHQLVNRTGGLQVDRHLVRVDKGFTDTVKGAVEINAWMVIQVPRGTTVATEQEVKNAVGRVIACLLASGATSAILAGES